MTSISHLYTDFGPTGGDFEEGELISTEEVQDEKLKAYEEGYQAGWTDAEKNVAAEQNGVGAELVHTLQDLAFTYHEALARLNRGLKPMFEQMISALLPRMLPPALRAHVVAELMRIAKTQSDAQIVLRVSDSDLMTIEDLLSEVEPHLDVTVRADAALTPNQLFLELELQEREINLEKVSQEIATALNAFNFHSQSESVHD